MFIKSEVGKQKMLGNIKTHQVKWNKEENKRIIKAKGFYCHKGVN